MRRAGGQSDGRADFENKVDGKNYQEIIGGETVAAVFTPGAVSVRTSIKTLLCPCTESEYISVH